MHKRETGGRISGPAFSMYYKNLLKLYPQIQRKFEAPDGIIEVEMNGKKEYFSDKNDQYYQYASTLRISNVCLKCHGKKEDAPKFIQSTYEDSYDYKIGELRGIISIKVPTENLNSYFFNNFIKSSIYDLILFFLLYLGINYLVNKSKKINS